MGRPENDNRFFLISIPYIYCIYCINGGYNAKKCEMNERQQEQRIELLQQTQQNNTDIQTHF